MLKIIFAGTPEFACPCLQALLESEHKVIAVYTQPDRPAGRGQQLSASPVKQLAMAHDLPLFQPDTLRESAEEEILSAFGADLMVVVAYGLILPKAVLKIPRYGCINVHASLLPRWRGAAPIQHAILAGDDHTGVTIMQMDEGLDTGPMLGNIQCTIGADDTSAVLHDRLAKLGPEALLMAIDAMESGREKPQKQEDAKATYAAKIAKADALINWHQPALIINRQVRAYTPWPVAYAFLGDERIRICKAAVLDLSCDQPPGTVIAAGSEGIDVATSNGVLRITALQLAGKKVMPAEAVLHSKQALFAVGAVFEGQVASDEPESE